MPELSNLLEALALFKETQLGRFEPCPKLVRSLLQVCTERYRLEFNKPSELAVLCKSLNQLGVSLSETQHKVLSKAIDSLAVRLLSHWVLMDIVSLESTFDGIGFVPPPAVVGSLLKAATAACKRAEEIPMGLLVRVACTLSKRVDGSRETQRELDGLIDKGFSKRIFKRDELIQLDTADFVEFVTCCARTKVYVDTQWRSAISSAQKSRTDRLSASQKHGFDTSMKNLDARRRPNSSDRHDESDRKNNSDRNRQRR